MGLFHDVICAMQEKTLIEVLFLLDFEKTFINSKLDQNFNSNKSSTLGAGQVLLFRFKATVIKHENILGGRLQKVTTVFQNLKILIHNIYAEHRCRKNNVF